MCIRDRFSQTEVLGRMAMGRMLAGLSTRHYPAGLEPVGHRVEQTGRSTSKSAVSRRFVAATETALGELLSADLSELDLVALMIDGVHFGDHLCVVALGIGIDGVKHPLGLAEGSTENTTVVTDLLTGLGDRGPDTTRAIFVGIGGGKALRAAVERVFEHPVIQRCQLHKIRNVADKLPDHLASTVTKRMRAAYRADSALAAEAQLQALAKELDGDGPGAVWLLSWFGGGYGPVHGRRVRRDRDLSLLIVPRVGMVEVRADLWAPVRLRDPIGDPVVPVVARASG